MRELGFPECQWKSGLLVEEIGNTYAGSALVGLTAILDIATAGQLILVVSYGSGAVLTHSYCVQPSVLLTHRVVLPEPGST